jgi:hypothetical protein
MADQAHPTTRRELQFENDHLKVWKTIILPNQPLNLHRRGTAITPVSSISPWDATSRRNPHPRGAA